MLAPRGLAIGHRARSALLAMFVVSPFARNGGRRSAASVCMASGSLPEQPGWVNLIDESIKKNDVAHKNYGARLLRVPTCVLPCVCAQLNPQ